MIWRLSTTKLKRDQISSIFLLFFAGIIFIASLEESFGSFSGPGPAFVPSLVALLLGIFSLVNLIVGSIGKGKEKEDPIFNFSQINWKNLIKTLGAVLAFPLLLGVLGFNLVVFGFMFFLSKAIEPRRWLIAISFALITTLVVYFLFVYWLKYYVEKGILGI